MMQPTSFGWSWLNGDAANEHSVQPYSHQTAAAAASKPQLIDSDFVGEANPEEHDMMMELAGNYLRQVSSSH